MPLATLVAPLLGGVLRETLEMRHNICPKCGYTFRLMREPKLVSGPPGCGYRFSCNACGALLSYAGSATFLAAGAWALVLLFAARFGIPYLLTEPYDLIATSIVTLPILVAGWAAVCMGNRYELVPLTSGAQDAPTHRTARTLGFHFAPTSPPMGFLTRLPLFILGTGALASAWFLWSLPGEWARDTYEEIGVVFVVAVFLGLTSLAAIGLACIWVSVTGRVVRLAYRRSDGDR